MRRKPPNPRRIEKTQWASKYKKKKKRTAGRINKEKSKEIDLVVVQRRQMHRKGWSVAKDEASLKDEASPDGATEASRLGAEALRLGAEALLASWSIADVWIVAKDESATVSCGYGDDGKVGFWFWRWWGEVNWRR